MSAMIITSKQLRAMAGDLYDGVLLDMDGTILDSMGMWQEIDRRFLEKRGIPHDPEYCDMIKTMAFPDGARFTIDRYGLDETVEAIMQEWDDMCIEMYKTEIELKPGAREMMTFWKEQGIPEAIVSMSKKFMVETAVEMYGIMPLLSGLVYMESTGKGKHVPDSFLYGVDLLKTEISRTLVMEDSLTAVKTAKAAGFVVCGVYDPSAETTKEEILQAADYYLESWK